jgi:hypothetical protein
MVGMNLGGVFAWGLGEDGLAFSYLRATNDAISGWHDWFMQHRRGEHNWLKMEMRCHRERGVSCSMVSLRFDMRGYRRRAWASSHTHT